MQSNAASFESPSTPVESPAWHEVVAAPWVGIWQPRRTAAILAAATRPAFWASYAVGATALAVIVLTLTMWDASVRDYSASKAVDASALTGGSLVQVWREWHAQSVLGTAEWILFLVYALLPIVMGLGAWLFLPSVHCGGRIRDSLGRAFRAMTAGLGLFVILLFPLHAGIVLVKNTAELRAFPGGGFVIGTAILATACLFVAWLSRAVRGVTRTASPPSLPPRCEDCGYDLSHIPRDGLCPECGLHVDESLTPNRRRPGAAWERGRSPGSWLATSFAVLFRPARFYAALRMRGHDQHSHRFAVFHYLSIAAGAFSTTLVIAIRERIPIVAIVAVPSFCAFFVPLVCWATHRLIGTVVTSWWVSRDRLPDVRWAATVIAFEATYLWVPCGFVALFAGSLTVFGPWLTQLSIRSPLPGIPVEPVAILLGCTILCLAWFWRYRSAIRSIRWSNF